jgi:hypothetical protein
VYTKRKFSALCSTTQLGEYGGLPWNDLTRGRVPGAATSTVISRKWYPFFSLGSGTRIR